MCFAIYGHTDNLNNNYSTKEFSWLSCFKYMAWHCLPKVCETDWKCIPLQGKCTYPQSSDLQLLCHCSVVRSWGFDRPVTVLAHGWWMLASPAGAVQEVSCCCWRPCGLLPNLSTTSVPQPQWAAYIFFK